MVKEVDLITIEIDNKAKAHSKGNLEDYLDYRMARDCTVDGFLIDKIADLQYQIEELKSHNVSYVIKPEGCE